MDKILKTGLFFTYILFFMLGALSLFPTFCPANEDYRFERMWPTLKEPWYFFGPSAVAVAADGSVYVVDSYIDRIKKFDNQGRFVSEWGRNGGQQGEFDGPVSIAVDSKGNVYVADLWNFRVQKFDSNGQFINAWGHFGDNDGEFSHLNSIATDNHYIYVTDTFYVEEGTRIGSPRVQKFTLTGEFVASWGGFGNGPGLFANPAAICIDKDGFVYVTDTQYIENEDEPGSGIQFLNHRVQKFTGQGEFISQWGAFGKEQGQFEQPEGIAVDNKGNVYVADTANERIQKFTVDGQFISQWGRPMWEGDSSGFQKDTVYLDSAVAIASDGKGSLFIAELSGQKIQKVSDEGQPIMIWGSSGAGEGWFRGALDIAVDSNGYVYVADEYNGRVQKFTATGVFELEWGRIGGRDGEFYSPAGVAVSDDGFVYVIDGDNRVQKFTSVGGFVTSWGSLGNGAGQFAYPAGIVVDNAGYVYVTDGEYLDDSHNIVNHRVQKFTSSGDFVIQWGGFGTEPGKFNTPIGIQIDKDGYVYVADAYNYRIQKFTSNGEFVSQWGEHGDDNGQFADPSHIAIGFNSHIYVADKWNYRIQEFTADGQFVSTLGGLGTDPGLFSLPTSLAFGVDSKLYVCDKGYNRIQVFSRGVVGQQADEQETGVEKAIILAGSGPYTGNTLWDATRLNTNHAYRVLTYQGFTKDNIYYLSADTDVDLDGNGKLDDVDGEATNVNLQYSITDWAVGANNVTIYLVGHGGNGLFRMGETEMLAAADLDSWLDTLQQSISGTLLLIYDACESGSFIPFLMPSAGQSRIFLTSTSPFESAYFINAGSISFSYTFWAQIFNGGDVFDSFITAKNGINFTQGNQNPLLDDNGNGVANEKDDGFVARDYSIGMGVIQAADLPVIGSISLDPILNGETLATIRVGKVTSSGAITRVWAVITPPGSGGGTPDTPVISLPIVELHSVDNNSYEADYEEFNLQGEYLVAVFASDDKGNISLPVNGAVLQTRSASSGPDVTVATVFDGQMDIVISIVVGVNKGTPADWWMVADTPEGMYYLNLSPLNWQRADFADLAVTLQGELLDFEAYPLNNIPGLPTASGVYTFYFGVDLTMNGILDEPLYYSSDQVDIR